MVVLLKIEGNCSCLRAKVAHMVIYQLYPKHFDENTGGNQLVHFSAIILREHLVGWSTFGLANGHFSVIKNTLLTRAVEEDFMPFWK
jgi:hypothetical protein